MPGWKYLAELNQSCDNSAAETGLTSRVEMNHTETRSSLAGKIRLVLSAGVALLLCLTGAGCSGFFISPSISSIYVTPFVHDRRQQYGPANRPCHLF